MKPFDPSDPLDRLLIYDREEFKRLEKEELVETRKAKEIAKRMLNINMSIEKIKEFTGLTIDEIESLKTEN